MRRFLWIVALLVACGPAEDPVRTGLRTRLKQETRLTPTEIHTLFEQIGPAIADKKVTVKEGALVRTLNDEQRTAVLGMLSDPAVVYDAGLKTDGGNVWRGLRTGATSPMSELDAMQTLWIDVETFTPRRYEFEYSSPGFGDYAYDLAFMP
jgi:hypothetical protein